MSWVEKINEDLRQMPEWHVCIIAFTFLIFIFSMADLLRGIKQIGEGPTLLPVFNIILMAVCLFSIILPFVMVRRKRERISKERD